MPGNPPTTQDFLDLSANENPLGPSVDAIRAISDGAGTAHRYPDAEGRVLKTALAAALGVPAGYLVLGNGSCEVLELTARAVLTADNEVIIGWPSFPTYRAMVGRIGAKATLVPLVDYAYDLDAIAGAVTARTRLIVLANPNNPTGLTIGQAAFARFLARIRGDIVILVDEAYREYIRRDDVADALAAVASGRQLVVTRSFSKIYGLAGLRIGYGIAPASLAMRIDAERQRFNVSGVGQKAAIAALADTDHRARGLTLNTAGRQWLEHRMTAHGLFCLPSQANFVMVRVGDGKGVHARLRARGILIKPLDAAGLPECIRISVGRPEENERLMTALLAILPTLAKDPAPWAPTSRFIS